MPTLPELARTHTNLLWQEIAHLKRLTGSWGFLADFAFSDLLLLVPVAGSGGRRFVVGGQVRPTTGQTLYLEDMVGQVFDETERPIATKCWHTGDLVQGPALITSPSPPACPCGSRSCACRSSTRATRSPC